MVTSDSALRLREYQPADFEELYRIDQLSFTGDLAFSRAELRFYLRQRDAIVRIIEADGRIAGFVLGRTENARAGHVISLDVVPEMRRRRVGTRLIEALHAEFERRRVTLVFLEVDATNAAARAFYEGLGYVGVATLPGYYAGRRDAIQMVRKI